MSIIFPSPLAGEGGPQGRMRGHPDVWICIRRRVPHRPLRHDPSSVSLRLPPVVGSRCAPPPPARGEGRLHDGPGKDRRLHQGRHQPL